MILDTNAVSAHAAGVRAVGEIVSSASRIAIPAIVLGEYLFGVYQSSRRAANAAWLNAFVRDCRVLNVDEHTAECYAQVRGELKAIGKLIPANDLWIAALCRQHSLQLLTRDSHFQVVRGLRVVTW